VPATAGSLLSNRQTNWRALGGAWCAVSFWLTESNIVQPEVVEELDTAYLINNGLEEVREGWCPQSIVTEHLKKERAAL